MAYRAYVREKDASMIYEKFWTCIDRRYNSRGSVHTYILRVMLVKFIDGGYRFVEVLN